MRPLERLSRFSGKNEEKRVAGNGIIRTMDRSFRHRLDEHFAGNDDISGVEETKNKNQLISSTKYPQVFQNSDDKSSARRIEKFYWKKFRIMRT